MKLSDYLPLIYKDKWEGFEEEFCLQETTATCGQCIMAPKTYGPNIKCCTFYPFIPNYAVGALLSEAKSVGAQRITNLLMRREYILPIGVVAPRHYQWKHQNKKAHEFGRRKDLLCPFYQDGEHNCTVWAARGAECATFFCKSSYKEKGQAFWDHVRSALYNIEVEFCQNFMLEKGYTPREIENNLRYIRWPLDGEKEPSSVGLSESEWQNLWLHHAGNETEYFLKCYELFLQEPKLSLNIPEVLRSLD